MHNEIIFFDYIGITSICVIIMIILYKLIKILIYNGVHKMFPIKFCKFCKHSNIKLYIDHDLSGDYYLYCKKFSHCVDNYDYCSSNKDKLTQICEEFEKSELLLHNKNIDNEEIINELSKRISNNTLLVDDKFISSIRYDFKMNPTESGIISVISFKFDLCSKNNNLHNDILDLINYGDNVKLFHGPTKSDYVIRKSSNNHNCNRFSIALYSE